MKILERLIVGRACLFNFLELFHAWQLVLVDL